MTFTGDRKSSFGFKENFRWCLKEAYPTKTGSYWKSIRVIWVKISLSVVHPTCVCQKRKKEREKMWDKLQEIYYWIKGQTNTETATCNDSMFAAIQKIETAAGLKKKDSRGISIIGRTFCSLVPQPLIEGRPLKQVASEQWGKWHFVAHRAEICRIVSCFFVW